MRLLRFALALMLFTPHFARVASAAPRLAAPPLVHGGIKSPPEVEQLLEAVYGAGLPPQQCKQRAEDVLARYPTSSRAHEVAGWCAQLLGDADGSNRHFLAAAADLDSDATALYLWTLDNDPRSVAEATAALLESLLRQHPRGAVRSLAAVRLAQLYDRFGRVKEADALIAQQRFIRDWLVLGALDNDQGKGFLKVFPPEEKIEPNATVAGPLVPLSWRKLAASPHSGALPLGDHLWPNTDAIAYLVTWIHSDVARQAQLRVATRAPLRAFLNGRVVASHELIASGDHENVIAALPLRAGWNKLMIKSANRRSTWTLTARITDGEGVTLPGLEYSTDPQTASSDKEPSDDPTVRAIEIGGPVGRKQLLESRAHARAGHLRDSLAAVQPFLDANPHNPLALFFAAMAFADNQEAGRAIDLFNRGVEETQAPGFYVRRGRYYLQKQLWEKAQADLQRAIALAPGSRGATTWLAELFEKRGWTTDRCRLLEGWNARTPDDGYTLRELAQCKDSLGYAQQAEQALLAIEKSSPRDTIVMQRRFELMRRRSDLTGALKLLARLRAIDPTRPDLLLYEGDVLRKLGDHAGAQRAFLAAAQLQPESPRAWDRIAQLAYERGQTKEALDALKRTHDRDPTNAAISERIEFMEPTRLGFIEKFVPTEVEIDAALAKKPTTKRTALAAMLMDHEVTEINSDGSSRHVVTQISQALDEKGRDLITHHQLPSHGTLKLLRAYAVTERGERQEASSVRGGEVRFRALQVGSRVVLQYVHYAPSKKFLPSSFASDWFFQDDQYQHEDSTWIVVEAKDRPLHIESIGPVEHRVSTEGDKRVHIFHAAAQPALPLEPHMSPSADLLTQVSVSNVESWDEVVRWERALLTDAFVTNAALDTLTDKLIGDTRSPREKLDKLFHYAAQEIRYQQDYESSIAGVRPHAASAVIERGYGDCKDKAVLLIQMAKRAGIAVQFAILRTQQAGHVRRGVPDQQFNHAIVYVPKQTGIDEGFFLDPTSDGLDVGYLRADDQGATSLVLDPIAGTWQFRDIPREPADRSFNRHRFKIDIASEGEVKVHDDVTVRGMTAMALRHALRNETEAKKLLQVLAAAFVPGSTLVDGGRRGNEDTRRPLEIGLDLDASHALRSEEGRLRMTLPGVFGFARGTTLSQRATPLYLGAADTHHSEIEVNLPESYRVAHAPKDLAIEQPCFSLSRKSKIEGRALRTTLDVVSKCNEVSVADYPAYREAVMAAQQSYNDDLIIEKSAKPATPTSTKARSRAR